MSDGTINPGRHPAKKMPARVRARTRLLPNRRAAQTEAAAAKRDDMGDELPF